MVSAVSAYEIGFKYRLGKLPDAAALVADFEGQMASIEFRWLSVSPAHAIAAARLDPFHRDPFDRILVAQALVENVPLISNEVLFDRFGVDRLW